VTRSTIQVGDLVRSIDSVDVDGDGDRDLVAVGEISESLTVLENGAGGFIGGTDIAVGDRPRSLDTFETGFSADHTVTIAVAGIGTSESGGAVYITGGQSAATRHPSRSGPIDVLVDDFNGDGLHDVLSASLRQSLLELRMGGSNDVLTTETLSAQVLSIDSGNLDSDELSREVVVSGYGFRPFGQTEVQPTKLEVFRISGQGGVTKFASIDVPAEVVEVEVADVIGNDPSDGIDDFVDEIVVLLHSGKLLVYPMSGGTIGEPIETAIRPGATAFDLSDRVNSGGRLIDFNGDGQIDVAVAHAGARPLSQSEPASPGFIELFTGTGDGRFARVTEIKNVSSPSDLVIDDFSGDGFAEIAVANFYGEADVDIEPPEFHLPSAITILQLELASREVTVTANAVTTEDFPFPSADPQIIFDTTGDHSVTALDALRVINELGRQALAEGEQIQSSRAPTDVNGDGRTSAIDALMIINYLRRGSVAESVEVGMDDLMDDDDDDRDQIIAAIDLLLTQGLASCNP
jgi:hypothetical protein